MFIFLSHRHRSPRWDVEIHRERGKDGRMWKAEGKDDGVGDVKGRREKICKNATAINIIGIGKFVVGCVDW
jgi:hypothetical protein